MNVRLTYRPSGMMTPLTWFASAIYLARDLLNASIVSKNQAADGTVTVELAFSTSQGRDRFMEAIQQANEFPYDGGSPLIQAL